MLTPTELTTKQPDMANYVGDANARLHALVNIGLEFGSDRSQDVRLGEVCSSVRELFDATYTTLGTVDADSRTVRRSFMCGVEDCNWIGAGGIVSGMLANVIELRKPGRGINPGGNPATLDLPFLHPQISAFLAVPMATRSRVYGWICLVRNEGNPFSDDDEQLLQALAGQIGRNYELENEVVLRTEAESALRSERDRAQLYLDTAEVVLLSVDTSGSVVMINRKGCELVEWPEPELLGRDWIDTCVPPEGREELRKKLQAVIGGDRTPIQHVVATRSGKRRLIEWRNISLRCDAEGKPAGLFASGSDITDQNQVIEALRTSEERMRFVLESANVGIWEHDFRTGKISWSDILQMQHGLEPGTFGGTRESFIACVHPEDRAAHLETLNAHLLGGDFTLPYRTLWADGTVRWLNGVGRIHLDEQGQPVRGVGITLDITDQRFAEERSQEGQKMEAIGRLASGVAHDFNNLLTVILGFAELLSSDDTLNTQHGEDVDEIIKAAGRAAGLTGQLLAFGRQQVLHTTAIDVNGLISETTGMLGRLIGEHIQVELSLSSDLPLAVADRSQLEQVVINLVVNAKDAMPHGGRLTIATKEVDVESSGFYEQPMREGHYVVLSISDTGEGMSRETQRRLFEPFYSTKELGKGTGLGLSTTYGIVKQSNGYIWVYSELGLGTTFNVYLPCAESDAVLSSVNHMHSPPAGTAMETVLLVEDEEGVRQFTKRILDAAGYRVLESQNGDDAEQLFIEHGDIIDLVVTDVVMPGCGGPELLERLRRRRPHLKAIYISGYTDRSVSSLSDSDGDVRFIQKPFRGVELLRHVRDALDH